MQKKISDRTKHSSMELVASGTEIQSNLANLHNNATSKSDYTPCVQIRIAPAAIAEFLWDSFPVVWSLLLEIGQRQLTRRASHVRKEQELPVAEVE